MGARAGEVNLISILAHLVNQQPVGLDVALPVPYELALERVVPQSRRQRHLLDEEIRHHP